MPGHVANRGQRRDGSTRWRMHWQHPYDASITKEEMHRNHKVAKAEIRRLDSEAHAGKLKPADHTTKQWADLVETWRETRWASLAPRTRDRYASVLGKHLTPEFNAKRVVDIDRATVRRFYGRLAQRVSDGEMTGGTAHKIAQTLSSVMTEAVESEWIAVNPCYRQRKLLGSSEATRKAQFLTRDELERLIAAMDPKYQLMIRFAAYTGARQSEILALQRRHCNLMHGEIRVERAVKQWVDGFAIYGPTKNGKARTVGLSRVLKVELSHHLDALPGGPDALVFAPSDGSRFWLSTWRRNYWTPALDDAFGDRDLHFHDLRHSCASMLIDSGASTTAIMAWMGHQTAQMTLGLYGHLMPNAVQDLAARLDGPAAGDVELDQIGEA